MGIYLCPSKTQKQNIMKHLRTLIIASLFAFTSLVSSAKDFTVTSKDGRRMHFSVVDEKAGTVELSRGSSEGLNYAPNGTLNVPLAVQNGNKTYKVVAIGSRALAGSDNLKSIVLPSSVTKIGSSAFENCIFLSEVTLPGSNTVIAEDAFKGCSALSSVKFGTDWTYIDFTPFGYCRSLEKVNIPSKVKKVAGITALGSVRKITVDESNPYFITVSGMLFDKTCSELVYCPVDCPRDLVIPDGTVSIRRGALSGCRYVENVYLPSSLEVLSYDEFSRMRDLESISFASKRVSVTGTKNGRDVFALEVDDDVDIYVQRKSVKHYRIAIENGSGVYESVDGVRKDVSREDLASPDQIKKAKRNRR